MSNMRHYFQRRQSTCLYLSHRISGASLPPPARELTIFHDLSVKKYSHEEINFPMRKVSLVREKLEFSLCVRERSLTGFFFGKQNFTFYIFHSIILQLKLSIFIFAHEEFRTHQRDKFFRAREIFA